MTESHGIARNRTEVTRRVICGGRHAVTVHAPVRTPDEQAAYLERVDAAIRRAFTGWKLRRPAAETEEMEEIV